MLNNILLYLGAAILFVWGVAHIIPTRNVVAGFGALSEDNRINITMEWVAEGLALAFVGALVALVTLVGGSQRSGDAGRCVGGGRLLHRHGRVDLHRRPPQLHPADQAVPAGVGRGRGIAGFGERVVA